jgi:hypothetical protein
MKEGSEKYLAISLIDFFCFYSLVKLLLFFLSICYNDLDGLETDVC